VVRVYYVVILEMKRAWPVDHGCRHRSSVEGRQRLRKLCFNENINVYWEGLLGQKGSLNLRKTIGTLKTH